MQNTDNLKRLHSNLAKKDGFNVPFEQFATDMQDETNFKRLYENLTKKDGFNVPYDQFKVDMFGESMGGKIDPIVEPAGQEIAETDTLKQNFRQNPRSVMGMPLDTAQQIAGDVADQRQKQTEEDSGFTTGWKAGKENLKGGLKYLGGVVGETLDKMDGEDDWQFDNRLLESARKNFEAAPRGKGLWYELGSFAPQMIGIAAASISAPLTAGTSLSAIPAIIGGANIGMLVGSASGGAMHEYDQYKEEKGEEGNDLARIGVGIGSGAAEYLAERIGLDRYMPKGSMSRAFTRFLSKNEDIAENIAKNAAKRNPSIVKDFARKTAKNMLEEGSEESLTEAGNILIETLYKDREDHDTFENIVSRMGSAFRGGAMMGGVLSPVTYTADRAFKQKMHFEKDGVKYIATQQDKDGNIVADELHDNFVPTGNKRVFKPGETVKSDQPTDPNQPAPTDAPQTPQFNPEDTFKAQIQGIVDSRAHESGNMVLANLEGVGPVFVNSGQVDSMGRFNDPDGMITYYDKEGNIQVAAQELFSGDVQSFTTEQFAEMELGRFRAEQERRKLASEQAIMIDGVPFVETGQTDEKGNPVIVPLDNNSNPIEAEARPISQEELDALKQAKNAQNQAQEQGQPQPQVEKAVFGKTEYQYTVNEDGSSDVLIPNKVDPNKALAEITKHFESNTKWQVEPVTETREVPARDRFSEPTTENILTGIRIVPKQIAIPVPSQDSKKSAKQAEPKYTFGKDAVTREEVAEMINLAETPQELEGLKIDNDPELQEMLLGKFPAPIPVYSIDGQEATEAQVKARIRLGKDLDKITIENNPELANILKEKKKKLPKDLTGVEKGINQSLNSQRDRNQIQPTSLTETDEKLQKGEIADDEMMQIIEQNRQNDLDYDNKVINGLIDDIKYYNNLTDTQRGKYNFNALTRKAALHGLSIQGTGFGKNFQLVGPEGNPIKIKRTLESEKQNIQDHPLLTDYSPEIQETATRFMGLSEDKLRGIKYDIPMSITEIRKAIQDIGNGERSPAANKFLDNLEIIHASGKVYYKPVPGIYEGGFVNLDEVFNVQQQPDLTPEEAESAGQLSEELVNILFDGDALNEVTEAELAQIFPEFYENYEPEIRDENEQGQADIEGKAVDGGQEVEGADDVQPVVEGQADTQPDDQFTREHNARIDTVRKKLESVNKKIADKKNEFKDRAAKAQGSLFLKRGEQDEIKTPIDLTPENQARVLAPFIQEKADLEAEINNLLENRDAIINKARNDFDKAQKAQGSLFDTPLDQAIGNAPKQAEIKKEEQKPGKYENIPDTYGTLLLNKLEALFSEQFPNQNFDRQGIIDSWNDRAQERNVDRANDALEDIVVEYYKPEERQNVRIDLRKEQKKAQQEQKQQKEPTSSKDVFPESVVEPLVFHGTANEFDEFSLEFTGEHQQSDFGNGISFSDKRNVAESFAKDAGGDNIMVVAINLKNPATNKDLLDPDIQLALDDDMGFKDVGQVLKEKGFDGVAFTHADGSVEYVIYDPAQAKIVKKEKYEVKEPATPLENKLDEIAGQKPSVKEIADANKGRIIIAKPLPLENAIDNAGQQKQQPEQKQYGADNKIVSNDRYEELRKRMKDKLNNLNAGFDPELLAIGAEMAAYHIEAGARKFTDFAHRMIADLGDAIKPYLKPIYNAARDLPGMEELETHMDDYSSVKAADLNNLTQNVEEVTPEPKQDQDNNVKSNKRNKPNGKQRVLQGNNKRVPRTELPTLFDGTGEQQRPGGSIGQQGRKISEANGNEQQPARREGNLLQGNADLLAPTLVEFNPEENDKKSFNPAQKYNDNIKAIETLISLINEKRKASSAEKEILSRYVGFGGLKDVLLNPDISEGWKESNAKYKPLVKRIIELSEAFDNATGTKGSLNSIRGSILNAHFTSSSVINSIYDGLSKLGFTGGRILEPSAGIGNFVTFMPTQIKQGSNITAVELDNLTGNVLKYLHDDVNVKVTGIQDANIPINSQDLVISNVPFGNYKIFDKSFKGDKTEFLNRIHNYFFAKAIDMTREGGLIAFVTSKGVLDAPGNASLRRYLDQQTDFLGAVRLPDTAFKNNANTEVVTDIIFLKKNTTTEKANPEFIHTKQVEAVHRDGEKQNVNVNQYFIDNPQNMLGNIVAGGLYSREDYTVENKDGYDLTTAIINALPDNVYSKTKSDIGLQANDSQQTIESIKEGNIAFSGDNLVRKVEGQLVDININEPGQKIKHYIDLRDSLMNLIYSEYIGKGDKELNELRFYLNRQYDTFVKKYGVITKSAVKIAKHDSDGYNVISLYVKGKQNDKADIFRQRTIQPIQNKQAAESIDEAIIISLYENAKIDIERIAELMKLSVPEVIQKSKGKLFEEPTGGFVTRDEYLSGNVKQKLKLAQQAVDNGNPEFQDNVNELLNVIPKDIPAVNIEARLGTRWIPQQVYTSFARDVFKDEDVKIIYRKSLDDYTHSGTSYTVEATTKYGTERMNGMNILIHALTINPPKIYDTVREYGTEKRILNVEETAKAVAKYEELRTLFEDWVYKDSDRRTLLSGIYNEKYNTSVARTYNGDHLNISGINGINLRKHQKDAIWMLLQNNGGIIDHLVGAGKTYVMVAGTMEMKRTGIAKKPMIIALKSTIPQIVESYRAAYPMAKVLAPLEKDFSRENRNKLFAQIANNEWDCIIMSHENYGKIPHEAEIQQKFIEDEMAEVEAERDELEAAGEKQALKGLEVRLKNLEARLQKISDIDKDNSITFEQMGIDHIMVDESQQFKNLSYVTKQRGIAGLSKPEGSKRAFNLFIGVRYLQQKYGADKGTTFLSGTPITNSMVEMYSLLKYLRPNKMDELGFNSFDSWATTFANPSSDIEFTVTGDFKSKTRFREFINVPELSMLYREIADIRTDENTPLDKPKMKGGGYSVVHIKMNKEQKRFGRKLLRFAKTKDGKHIGMNLTESQEKAYMLLATNLSSKMAIDLRLINPSYSYDPNGKIGKLVDNVATIFNETSEHKGTQLIFSDLGTPKNKTNRTAMLRDYMEDELGTNLDTLNEIFGDPNIAGYRYPSINSIRERMSDILELSYDEISTIIEDAQNSEGSFNVYSEVKYRLIEKGIPENQIVFIHDYNTQAKKVKLFKEVQNGNIRIVLGSTQKLGTGVNVQDRVVAIHHLDVPWTPAAMEQRNGRGLRQGNMIAKKYLNDELPVYAYATELTLDAYKYQLLDTKNRFLIQVKSGNVEDRVIKEAEGDDETGAGYAELVSMMSGNPDFLTKSKLEGKVDKLKRAKKSFQADLYEARSSIELIERRIPAIKLRIESTKENVKEITDSMKVDQSGKMVINDINGETIKPVKDEKGKEIPVVRTDYAKKAIEIINNKLSKNIPVFTKLFTINGISIYGKAEKSTSENLFTDKFLQIRSKNGEEYSVTFSEVPGILLNNIQKAIESIPTIQKAQERVLEKQISDLSSYKELVTNGDEWEKESELQKTLEELKEVTKRLEDSNKEPFKRAKMLLDNYKETGGDIEDLNDSLMDLGVDAIDNRIDDYKEAIDLVNDTYDIESDRYQEQTQFINDKFLDEISNIIDYLYDREQAEISNQEDGPGESVQEPDAEYDNNSLPLDKALHNATEQKVESRKGHYKTKEGETIQFQLTFGDNRTRTSNVQRQSDRSQNPSLRKLGPGEIASVENKYTLDRNFMFDGSNKIESVDDVAYIFRKLEDKSVENMFACLVKDGKATIIHMSMGNASSTIVNAAVLNDAISRFKPDKVYMIHNHPSGTLVQSDADNRIHQMLIEAHGDIIGEHIIINLKSGKYATFRDPSNFDHTIRRRPESVNDSIPYKVYKFDRQVFKNDTVLPKISESQDVAAFISAQRFTEGNKTSILILNRALKISAYIHVPYVDFSIQSSRDEFVTQVKAYTARFGGNSVIISGNFKNTRPSFQAGVKEVKSKLKYADISLLDLVSVNSKNSFDSMADMGLMEPEAQYKSRFLDDRLESGSYMPEKISIDGKERHTRNSNGQLIHPTRRGIENFYKWFGDSKVVDEQGRPLVVYHGTRSSVDFAEFLMSDSWGGTGAWFAGDAETASIFASRTGDIGQRLIPSYLKIEKPIEEDAYEKISTELEAKTSEAIANGYDGMITEGVFAPNYLVFSPNQIKSATGNDGGFDPGNPRIVNDPGANYKRTPLETIADQAGQNYREGKETKRSWNEIRDGMIEFYKDFDLPIRRLQEKIKELGGRITDRSNPYRDMTLAKGRMEALYKDYTETKMKPIIKTISKIINTGANPDNILPYTIAKHALERNPDLRNNEYQEWLKKQGVDENGNSNVSQEEIDAFLDTIKDKDYSGVMEFQEGWKNKGNEEYTNPEELAQAIVDSFEAGVNQNLLDELWDNIRTAGKATLDIWRAGNALTEEEYQHQLARYNNFVPLRGWREAAEKELAYLNRGSGQGTSLRHAEGRRSMAENPLAYMQNVAFKALAEQVDNEVKQSLLNLVVENYDKPAFKNLYKLRTAYYIKGILEDGTEGWILSRDANGELVRPPAEMFESGEATVKVSRNYERRRTVAQAKQHEVLVKGANTDVVIVFEGKNLSVAHAMNNQNVMYRSIFSKEYKDIDNWNRPLANSIGVINNLLKGMYTSFNIVFPLTNFSRDAQEAALSQWIAGESGVNVIKNYKVAFPAVYRALVGKRGKGKYDQLFKRFELAGGQTGFTHLKTPEQIEKELNRELTDVLNKGKLDGAFGRNFRHLINSIEIWNKLFEDATRFSVFVSAVEAGYTDKESARQAKEASVNFNRKGKSSKAFDSWWAFWNVALESMNKNFGLAKKAPARFATVAGGFALSGFLMAILNDMLPGDDDDDYYNIGDFARHNYLLLPNIFKVITEGEKGDKYLRIPLPQFWRGFYSAGSLMYDVINGKETATTATTKALINFAGGLSPVDIPGFYKEGKFSVAPLLPTVVKPIGEYVENRDFMGYRIAKEPFTKEQEEALAQAGLHKNNVNPAVKFFTDMMFRAGGGETDTGLKGRIDDGRVKYVPWALDWNPSKIEHLIKGYTGGTGGVVTDAITTAYQVLTPEQTVDFRNVPFVNAFIRKTPESKWKTIEKYYDARDEARKYEPIERAYRKIAYEGGDQSRYRDVAGDPYIQSYMRIIKQYDAIISLASDKMDFKTAEGSEKVLNLMEEAVSKIDSLKTQYKKK